MSHAALCYGEPQGENMLENAIGSPTCLRHSSIQGSIGVVRGDQIVSLAVMQLVEAGKIDLDAPVTHYLPRFRTDDPAASVQTRVLAPERSAGASVTVRNLLYQNSGLPAYEGLRGFWLTTRAPRRSKPESSNSRQSH
jgi:hypothetical protein